MFVAEEIVEQLAFKIYSRSIRKRSLKLHMCPYALRSQSAAPRS